MNQPHSPNESKYDDSYRINETVTRYSNHFRGRPSQNYLESLATHLSKNFSLYELRTIFQIAVSELDVFPSIAECERIAVENSIGKRGLLANRPTKIEYIACKQCDGYGLILVKNYELDRKGYCSCNKCENGKKQEFWNEFNLARSKGDKPEGYHGPCPKYEQAINWGYVKHG